MSYYNNNNNNINSDINKTDINNNKETTTASTSQTFSPLYIVTLDKLIHFCKVNEYVKNKLHVPFAVEK